MTLPVCLVLSESTGNRSGGDESTMPASLSPCLPSTHTLWGQGFLPGSRGVSIPWAVPRHLASGPVCQVHLSLFRRRIQTWDVIMPLLWFPMTLLYILVGNDLLLALVLMLSPSQGKKEVAQFRTEWHLGKGHLSGFSSHCLNLHYLSWGGVSLC